MDKPEALVRVVQLHRLALSTDGGERTNALTHIRRLRSEHGITNGDIGRALDVVEGKEGPKSARSDDPLAFFAEFGDAIGSSLNPVYYQDIRPRIKALQDELRAIGKEIDGLGPEEQVRPLTQLYADLHYITEGTGRGESMFVHGLGLKYRRDRAVTVYFNAKWNELKEEFAREGIRVQTGYDESHRPQYETSFQPELLDLMAWYYAREDTIKKSQLTKRQVLAIVGDKEANLQRRLDESDKKRSGEQEAP